MKRKKLMELKRLLDEILETAPTDEELNFDDAAIAMYTDLHNLKEGMEAYGIEPDDSITKERVIGILNDYVSNDVDGAELSYVQDVLADICGCTMRELQECGLDWIFTD